MQGGKKWVLLTMTYSSYLEQRQEHAEKVQNGRIVRLSHDFLYEHEKQEEILN